MQARAREDLAVVSLRIRRRLDVARVVGVIAAPGADDGVDDRGIGQRTVGGDAHDDVGVVLARRQHVAGQHIVLGARG